MLRGYGFELIKTTFALTVFPLKSNSPYRCLPMSSQAHCLIVLLTYQRIDKVKSIDPLLGCSYHTITNTKATCAV